jgi:hypothetical protein
MNPARSRSREPIRLSSIRASEAATEKALKLLEKPIDAEHAAKLLQTAYSIGASVFNLPGVGGDTAVGLRPTAPVNIVIRVPRSDAASQLRDMESLRFLHEHFPEHPQVKCGSWHRQLLDARYGEGWTAKLLNGEGAVASSIG